MQLKRMYGGFQVFANQGKASIIRIEVWAKSFAGAILGNDDRNFEKDKRNYKRERLFNG